MLYKGHLKAGIMIASTTALLYGLNKFNIGETVGLTVISGASSILTSLIPDLDSETSKLSRKFPIVKILKIISFIIMIYAIHFLFTDEFMLNKDGISGFLLYFCSAGFLYISLMHRKLLHSLIFNSLIGLLIYSYIGLENMFFIGLTVGMICGLASHLIGDCMTTDGCVLFYPIPIKVSFFHFKSGKDDSKICVIIFTVCITIIGIYLKLTFDY